MHFSDDEWTAKTIGRFYTKPFTAAFVTELVLQHPIETVLDPSCGNGVFLIEAANRLRALGAARGSTLTGIDLDEIACSEAAAVIKWNAPELHAEIINRDFFSVEPDEIGGVSAVLGNPPFVRYQIFSGKVRDRALRCAEDAGVSLSRQSNAWAPFVIHAISFLQPGGSLGLILPGELLHAAYAAPVLRHIFTHFEQVRVLTFDAPLFPALDVHAIALVASGAGGTCKEFQIVRVRNSNGIGPWTSIGHTIVENPLYADSKKKIPRVPEYYLPQKIRGIYRKIQSSVIASSVGQVVSVDIGYVTGDHNFFHLTKEGIRRWDVPVKFRVRTLRSARNMKCSVFTEGDWRRLRDQLGASYLLRIPAASSAERLERIKPYLAEGIRRRVNRRYQCRSRNPWYSVRGVRIADGFLTSMSSGPPKLVMNEAGVAASNNMHVITRREHVDSSTFKAITTSWYST